MSWRQQPFCFSSAVLHSPYERLERCPPTMVSSTRNMRSNHHHNNLDQYVILPYPCYCGSSAGVLRGSHHRTWRSPSDHRSRLCWTRTAWRLRQSWDEASWTWQGRWYVLGACRQTKNPSSSLVLNRLTHRSIREPLLHLDADFNGYLELCTNFQVDAKGSLHLDFSYTVICRLVAIFVWFLPDRIHFLLFLKCS